MKRNVWGELAKTLITQALVAAGVIAVTTYINKDEIAALQQEQAKDKELLVQMMEIDHIRNNLTIILTDRIDQMQKSTKMKNELNELINIAEQSLDDHNRQTKIYLKIINNNFRRDFFKIIDIDSFLENMKNIDQLLHPYARLPTQNPQEILDLSSLSYSNNRTHVSIYTKIPILTINNTYTLYEFVPIPFRKKHTIEIVNTNAKLFFNIQNSTKVMQPNFLSHFKQTFNHTICNSILHESLTKMDNCTQSIIKGSSLPKCEFKRIENRNYFIQITPHTVFCFIVSPIQFRIICNGNEKIYNLTENVEIDFANHCDLHKILNELHYDNKTFSTVETMQPLLKPNFSVFNSNANNWTDNIDILNQYNITLTKLIDITTEMENNLKPNDTDQMGIINNIPKSINSGFKGLINYISSQFYLAFCIYFVLPIVISSLIFCLCLAYIKK